MPRPKRSATRPKRSPKDDSGEFEDPLKNYDTPDYADELERSIAEDSVTVIKSQPFTALKTTDTVLAAMQHMAKHSIASLLVVDDDDKLKGIFSERDVLTRVADDFENVKDKPLAEIMTPEPNCVYVTDSPGKAMNLMATGGFRHVPILDVDDKVVGILGPRRVTNFLKQHL